MLRRSPAQRSTIQTSTKTTYTSTRTTARTPVRPVELLLNHLITFSRRTSEVRAAVGNTDDPDMPASTIRAWVIGVAFSILIPGLNQFFIFRYPSVTISGLVSASQLPAWPCVGCLDAQLSHLWRATQPRPFHHQRVRPLVFLTVMISHSVQACACCRNGQCGSVFCSESGLPPRKPSANALYSMP